MTPVRRGTSSVSGAGMGLFVGLGGFRRGQTVIEYTGKVLSMREARDVRNRSYIKAVSLTRHIDANVDYASDAKFINDHLDPSRINVRFKILKESGRVFVEALRDLVPGEELFVSYGRGHWLFAADAGTAEFLNLRVEKEGLIATAALPKKTVLCVRYSELFEDPKRVLGNFVKTLPAEDKERANCMIQKNPFIPGTTMLVASKDISKGETLYLGEL